MGWIEGLNASVDYIEEHLDGDVDIARAASALRSIYLGASVCSMWQCGMATLRQRRSIEHFKRS